MGIGQVAVLFLGGVLAFFEPEKYDFCTYKVFLCKKDCPNLLNFQKKKNQIFTTGSSM
jgi:hypothetical protein